MLGITVSSNCDKSSNPSVLLLTHTWFSVNSKELHGHVYLVKLKLFSEQQCRRHYSLLETRLLWSTEITLTLLSHFADSFHGDVRGFSGEWLGLPGLSWLAPDVFSLSSVTFSFCRRCSNLGNTRLSSRLSAGSCEKPHQM